MTCGRFTVVLFAFGFLAVTLSCPASAQELAPRSYWPAPKGTQVLVLGYGQQGGDVVIDPSLPLAGVDVNARLGLIAYQRTLSLLGRTTNFQVDLPYADVSATGTVLGEAGRADASGVGDLSATLAINLVGAPSMTRAEFLKLRQQPRPILAASIKIVAPTGRYDSDRLVNIGSNRWAVRARLGYIHPLNLKWLIEASVGAWLFGDNDKFLGLTLEQEPITAINVSLVRRIRPGFWASLDLNYYLGGRTHVGGTDVPNFQRNSRVGLTIAYPIKGRSVIKASYTNCLATEAGGDYDSISLSYIYLIS
jgi:hypothetical protein